MRKSDKNIQQKVMVKPATVYLRRWNTGLNSERVQKYLSLLFLEKILLP